VTSARLVHRLHRARKLKKLSEKLASSRCDPLLNSALTRLHACVPALTLSELELHPSGFTSFMFNRVLKDEGLKIRT